MSWNGTVTCRACYQTGHNQRSCPRVKERYEEALAKPEEDRDHNDRMRIERYERKKQSAKVRKCSYCDEKGHNRRSCGQLKEHMAHVVKQEVAFRDTFVKYLNKLGLGVGSLVQGTGTQIDNSDRIGVVTGIRWDNISIVTAHAQLERFLRVQPLRAFSDPRQARMFNISVPAEWSTGPQWRSDQGNNRWQEDYYKCEVLGSVGATVKPPSGWVNDMAAVKHFFQDRHSYQWPTESNGMSDYWSCDWWNIQESS